MTWKKRTRYSGWSSSAPRATGAGPVRCWADRVEEGFHSPGPLIGALERFWALGEERIILGSALMAHLRKRTNAQRLRLSTCKTGALPLSYGPMLTCA